MHLPDTSPGTMPSSANDPLATIPPTGDTNALTRIGGGSGLAFNGNQVKAATAHLAADHAREITWLFEHGRENRFDLQTLATKLRGVESGLDSGTLYSVFRGSFRGAVETVASAIQDYRKSVEARERITRPAFVRTKLTKQIFDICDRARVYQRMAMVFGDGQIGKTANLEEYTHENKTDTRYLRLPTEASLRLTVELLGRACHLNTHRPSQSALRVQIVQHFDASKLLIVDELQQITLARSNADRLATVEFLREIFDRSHCGMVLCGTNEAMQELEHGPNALWLRQLRRRSLPRVMLPSVASDADILAFAAYYGLGEDVPAEALLMVRDIAKQDGVGLLITFLQGAARIAATERVPTTWQHFLRTFKAFTGQAS